MPQKIDVEEGDKIIAEFMGAKINWSDIINEYKEGSIGSKKMEGETTNYIRGLKYHSSWDWLQPAWSKFYILCEKEFRSNETLYNQFADFRDNYNIHANHNNISAACETLVEAIQWYNQNNPQ